jgi:hypothetical protein
VACAYAPGTELTGLRKPKPNARVVLLWSSATPYNMKLRDFAGERGFGDDQMINFAARNAVPGLPPDSELTAGVVAKL